MGSVTRPWAAWLTILGRALPRQGGRRALVGVVLCALIGLGVYGGEIATASSSNTTAPTPSTLREGVYVGAANPSGVASFASTTGTDPAIASDYLPSDSGWSGMDGAGGSLSWMFADGWQGTPYTLSLGVPIIPTDSSGNAVGTLAIGATGAYNNYFVTLAQTLVAAGESDAYLRLGWEFDGGWYAWSATTPSEEASFATYFQQIVTAMRSVPGSNFNFVWNPDATAFTESNYDVTLAYPGNAYVDVIGLDAYDETWATPQNPANAWNETVFPALTAAQQFAETQGEPLAITEWAVTDLSDGHGLGDDPLYVNNFIAWMEDPANDVEFESYFDYDVTGEQNAITDSEFPNSLAAFISDLGSYTPASPAAATTTTTGAPPTPQTDTPTAIAPSLSGSDPVPDAPTGLDAPTNLVFDDEFDEGSLNTSVWAPEWFNDGATQNGTVLKASNVSVGSNGLGLNLAADGTGAIVSTDPDDHVAGHTGFQIAPTPGNPVYIEFNVTVPASPSGDIANWPALWLDGQNWPEDGEIDVMEGLGGSAAYHLHFGTTGEGADAEGASVNTSPGTHTYGAMWTTTGVTFFYDGVDVGTLNESLTSPEYLVMENSDSSGGPSLLPATLTVRYVRVWQGDSTTPSTTTPSTTTTTTDPTSTTTTTDPNTTTTTDPNTTTTDPDTTTTDPDTTTTTTEPPTTTTTEPPTTTTTEPPTTTTTDPTTTDPNPTTTTTTTPNSIGPFPGQPDPTGPTWTTPFPFHWSDGNICGSIDYHYLFGVATSQNGAAISLREAYRVQRMLHHATGLLRAAAGPLHEAIISHNETAIINDISNLPVSVCLSSANEGS